MATLPAAAIAPAARATLAGSVNAAAPTEFVGPVSSRDASIA